MKPTQEQVIAWAREVGLDDDVHYWSIRLSVVRDLTALAYEAGRKDENEACAKVCEDDCGNGALNLADAIRARGQS